MMRIYKIILLTLFMLFGSVLLTEAQVKPLIVEFETNPLFREANFLPSVSVTRWVKVTNNSDSSQRIAVETLTESDSDNFASQLNLTIKEGETVIYNNTLANFFSQGETYLSSLASGANTKYDFTIGFNSASDNDWQGKSLGFDVLVGFESAEGGLILPPPGSGFNGSDGGGGGGGGENSLPPGLTIQNESAASSTGTSVTITWLTSYPATSQVIYAEEGEAHILDLTDASGNPPKYGYARTTLEYDNPANINGQVSHSVTIFGLTPGTKYYYRAVSHGSFAISEERNFITLTANFTADREIEAGGKEIGEIVTGIKREEFVAAAEQRGEIAGSFQEKISEAAGAGLVEISEVGDWVLILILAGLIIIVLAVWRPFRKKAVD